MYPVNPVARGRPWACPRRSSATGSQATGRRNDWILATKHPGEGQSSCVTARRSTSATITGRHRGVAEAAQDRRDRPLPVPLAQSRLLHVPQELDLRSVGAGPRRTTLQHMHDALGALEDEVERRHDPAFRPVEREAPGARRCGSTWPSGPATPRVASIQNEYSLLCRLADTDLPRLMVNEHVGLLPFSPLAAGLLTGKYQDGALPEGSRMAINGDLGGRKSDARLLGRRSLSGGGAGASAWTRSTWRWPGRRGGPSWPRRSSARRRSSSSSAASGRRM